jgi:hypothetical protein
MKIPIVIQNSKIPQWLSIFINIWAITIWPFVICRGEMDEVTLNHEKIHIKQQAELLLIGFYLLYGGFWLWNRLWHRMSNQEAYMNIPFEREAYSNDNNLEYLGERKWYAWLSYCK